MLSLLGRDESWQSKRRGVSERERETEIETERETETETEL